MKPTSDLVFVDKDGVVGMRPHLVKPLQISVGFEALERFFCRGPVEIVCTQRLCRAPPDPRLMVGEK